MTKLINYLSLGLILFCLVTLIYAFYLHLWPFKVVTIVTPLPVLITEVRAGEELQYVVDYCKYRDLPATITRQLVGKQVIFFPEVSTTLPTGCHKGTRTLTLPENMLSGEYVLSISATYILNVLRSETFTYQTVPFRVLP